MTWTIIQNLTSANPDNVNDDFLWVAQGSITPKSGTSFVDSTATTSNIGASTTQWKDAYVTNIHPNSTTVNVNNNNLLWSKVVEVYPTTTRVEITGLNGDRDKIYDIMTYLNNGSDTTMHMFMNGDSASANYLRLLVSESSGTFYATSTSVPPRIAFAATWSTASQVSMAHGTFHVATGQNRMVFVSLILNAQNSAVGGYQQNSYQWLNTTSTLTSIVIASTIPRYAHFILWRRG